MKERFPEDDIDITVDDETLGMISGEDEGEEEGKQPELLESFQEDEDPDSPNNTTPSPIDRTNIPDLSDQPTTRVRDEEERRVRERERDREERIAVLGSAALTGTALVGALVGAWVVGRPWLREGVRGVWGWGQDVLQNGVR